MAQDAATAASGEPPTTAALLARAQQVADQLVVEAREEAERLTADLATLREQTRLLKVEAERDRAEAGRLASRPRRCSPALRRRPPPSSSTPTSRLRS